MMTYSYKKATQTLTLKAIKENQAFLPSILLVDWSMGNSSIAAREDMERQETIKRMLALCIFNPFYGVGEY